MERESINLALPLKNNGFLGDCRIDFTAFLRLLETLLVKKDLHSECILFLFKQYDQEKKGNQFLEHVKDLHDFILNQVLREPKKYNNIAIIWLYSKTLLYAKMINLDTNEFEHKVWQEFFRPMLPDLAASWQQNPTWKEPVKKIIGNIISSRGNNQYGYIHRDDLSGEAKLFLVTTLLLEDPLSNLTLWNNFWNKFGFALYEYNKIDPLTWRIVWKTLPGNDLFQAPFAKLPYDSFGEYAQKVLGSFEIDWHKPDAARITAKLLNEKINFHNHRVRSDVSTWVSSLFLLVDFIHVQLANPQDIPKVDICQTLMEHTIREVIKENLLINTNDMAFEHNTMLQHVVKRSMDSLKLDEKGRGVELLEKLKSNNQLSQMILKNNWEELAQFLKENNGRMSDQMYPNVNLSTKTFADKLAIHTIQPLLDHTLQEGAKLEASVAHKKKAVQSLTLQREKLLRQAAALKAQVVNINTELKVESEQLVMTKRKQDTLDQNLKFFRSALAKHEPALTKWQQKMQSDLSDWNLDDVLVFLTEIGLDKYTTEFTENKIDGAVLEQLETNDLMTVLKVPFKDAKKILMYVYLVQTHHDVYTIPPGVLQWNNDTVCTWLEDNKFGHLVDIFKKNEVVGAELAFLEKADLMTHYKILALGDVMKLQKEISKLKDSMKDERFLQAQMQNNNNNNADFVQVQRQLEEMKRFNDELKIALKEKNTKIPEAFICPITQDMMQDPVVASDGHTYERTAIELWLKNNNSSPMTGLQLANKQLTPSHTLKSMIHEFVDLAKKK